MTTRTFTFNVQSASAPTWSYTTVGVWTQIVGTKLTDVMTDTEPFSCQKNMITSYSGAALDETTSNLYLIGGGHADSANNGCYRLVLNDAAPRWEKLRGPTPQGSIQGNATGTQNQYKYYSDGRPTSRHTYYHLSAQPTLNRVILHGGAAIWGDGNGNTSYTDAFDWVAGDYVIPTPYSNSPVTLYGGACVKTSSGDVWMTNYNSGSISKWSLSSQTYATVGSTATHNKDTAIVYDSLLDRVVMLPRGGTLGRYWSATGTLGTTTFNTTGVYTAATFPEGSAVYEPVINRYLFLPHRSRTVYSVHPTTFAVEVYSAGTWTIPVDGNGVPTGTGNYYGRFSYVPQLSGVVVVPEGRQDIYWMRTS